MELLEILIKLSKEESLTSILNLTNIIFVFFTVLISYLSWKAVRKANEIKVLPLIAIYFKGKTLKDRVIRIRNIGMSPAYDIKIESYSIIVKDIHEVWRLEMNVKGTNVLIPEEERTLHSNATRNGKKAKIGRFLMVRMDPDEGHERPCVKLRLTFKNVEGKKYFSKVETGKGGLYIKSVKRISTFYRLIFFCKRVIEKIQLSFYGIKWRVHDLYDLKVIKRKS